MAAQAYVTLLNAKIEANARIQVSPLPGEGPHPLFAEQGDSLHSPMGPEGDVTQPWEMAPRTW